MNATAERQDRLAPPRRVRCRIGILGHVGNQNLGDEALIAAVIQNLRDRTPAAELIAFTSRPEDTRRRHGIQAYPIRPPTPTIRRVAALSEGSCVNSRPTLSAAIRERLRRMPFAYPLLRPAVALARWIAASMAEQRNLVTSFRLLQRIDLLVVAGSNQLSDYYGGPWRFPYSLLRWTLLARLAGVRVAYTSVGAGPIRSPLSRVFIRGALRQAAYRSYRDAGSRETTAALGVRGEGVVVPDLAYSLRFERPCREQAPEGARLTVGINPIPFFDRRYWPEQDARIYDRYVETLAAFAAWVQGRGYAVRFFPTQLRADPPVIDDIRYRMRASSALTDGLIPENPRVTSFEDLVRLIAEMDIVVASRYHGIIFAHLMGKPTLGIVYRRSTDDLLCDLGLTEFTLAIETLTVEQLIAGLTTLASHRLKIAEQIGHHIRSYQDALARQYDRLVELVL